MTKNAPSALVIDDEAQMRRLLKLGLEGSGFQVLEALSGGEGLKMLVEKRPDILILDLGLPDLPGLQVLKRIREFSEVPVIILSVQDDEGAKIEALDAGADDFLTKPFSIGELLARMRVCLRSEIAGQTSSVYSWGENEINLANRVVRRKGREVHLSVTEYKLLLFFVKHAGKVLTHQQILKEVWGQSSEHALSYLRVYVGNLRKKLEDDPANPRFFVSESGVGYRLKID